MEEWQDETYSAVFVLVPVEYWNKLLWAENLLVTLQVYGTKLQGYWNAGKSDQYLLLCNEDLTLSGWAVSEYRTKSVQEFRFELSQGIRSQIFLTNFVRNIETHIKSNVIIKALKQLIRQQVY